MFEVDAGHFAYKLASLWGFILRDLGFSYSFFFFDGRDGSLLGREDSLGNGGNARAKGRNTRLKKKVLLPQQQSQNPRISELNGSSEIISSNSIIVWTKKQRSREDKRFVPSHTANLIALGLGNKSGTLPVLSDVCQ